MLYKKDATDASLPSSPTEGTVMKKTLLAILIASSATSAFAVSAQTGFSIGAAGGWSYAQSPNVNAPKKNKNYTLLLYLYM